MDAAKLHEKVKAFCQENNKSYALEANEHEFAEKLVKQKILFYCGNSDHVMAYRDVHRDD
jgi:hypothetical protein